MRLVQQCLFYSAKSHWQARALNIAHLIWRKSISIKKKATLNRGRAQKAAELEGKAKRLSLQMDMTKQRREEARVNMKRRSLDYFGRSQIRTSPLRLFEQCEMQSPVTANLGPSVA